MSWVRLATNFGWPATHIAIETKSAIINSTVVITFPFVRTTKQAKSLNLR